MSISSEKKDGIVQISYNDKAFSRDSAHRLKELVLEYIDNGEKDFVLHFVNTDFTDSSGIGKLLFLHKKISAIPGTLKIETITEKFYNFLESLTINKVIDIKKPS